jgi:hypothetical protein
MSGLSTLMHTRRRLVEAAQQDAESARDSASTWDAASLADFIQMHVRQFLWERDRFAETYQKALSQAPRMTKEDIDEVVREALPVCRSALALRDRLRRLLEQLDAGEQLAETAKQLEDAAADYERWLEDVPDEMLVHYRPVTEAIEQIALESLRNPPPASDWRSWFDDNVNSPP